MPDLSHLWGNDLTLSPTGDLATADTPNVTQQRVLRRLLTKSWRLHLVARLRRRACQLCRHARRDLCHQLRDPWTDIQGVGGFAQTPAPVIDLQPDQAGDLYVTISYADADTASPKPSPSPPRAAAPMQLQLQDFTTLVRNMAASVQGSANALQSTSQPAACCAPSSRPTPPSRCGCNGLSFRSWRRPGPPPSTELISIAG